MVGGHSIEDDEPKYGLSVFGLVHPERMVRRNGGAQPGDALYYTKTLGTGIMNAALRASCHTDEDPRPVIDGMMELNRAAARPWRMRRARVHRRHQSGLLGICTRCSKRRGAQRALDWEGLAAVRRRVRAFVRLLPPRQDVQHH